MGGILLKLFKNPLPKQCGLVQTLGPRDISYTAGLSAWQVDAERGSFWTDKQRLLNLFQAHTRDRRSPPLCRRSVRTDACCARPFWSDSSYSTSML